MPSIDFYENLVKSYMRICACLV